MTEPNFPNRIVLLIGVLFVSSLLVALVYEDVNISAIDAATAGVLSFSLLLNLVVVFDHIVTAQWAVIEDPNCDIATDIDEHGNIIEYQHHDRTPLIARLIMSTPVGERNGYESTVGIHPLSFVERYLQLRTVWWFGAEDLYRSTLSRYIPLFLISGTAIARFILGEPIIPLTG